jgi:uncharacterized protein (DUF1330 family)
MLAISFFKGMNMPKGYWIARVTINNPDRYPDYVSTAKPAFEKYGAKFLVRGGQYDPVEGDGRPRNVVIEFASYEQARECYHSPEYQAAAAIRQECADGEIVLVEGAE